MRSTPESSVGHGIEGSGFAADCFCSDSYIAGRAARISAAASNTLPAVGLLSTTAARPR